MLKLDPFFLSKNQDVSVWSAYLILCPNLFLSERKGIHFTWKVGNFFLNREGKVAHISHAETGSSF